VATLFRLLLVGNLALLLLTAGVGIVRPVGMEAPEVLHMPLGLLTCVVTVLVQAYFFSFLLTSSWDIEHVAEKQGKAPALAEECHRVKARGVGLVMVPAMTVVITGILGMASRVGIVAGHVHGAVGGVVILATLAGLVWAPGLVGNLEVLGGQLCLSDREKQELGNR
jgi:hypothetical protein